MSGVKRYSALKTSITLRQPYASPNTAELVLASDYDQLRTANQRLEGEVKRLRDALAIASDYLDGNQLSSIASGSTCHRKMRAALSTANGEVTE